MSLTKKEVFDINEYHKYQHAVIFENDFRAEFNYVTQKAYTQDCQTWYELQYLDLVTNIVKDAAHQLSIYNDTQSDCYGPEGLFERLISFQKRYTQLSVALNYQIDLLLHPCYLVEDGSIDIDDLCEEGLAPGKVLVYRQGSNSPIVAQGTNDKVITELRLLREEVVNELHQYLNFIKEKYNIR